MTDKSDTYKALAQAAKTAQAAAKDLDSVLGQLENRQINLTQAAVKLGADWAKTYGDLDARGKALVNLFEILGNKFLSPASAAQAPLGAGRAGAGGSVGAGGFGGAAGGAPPINVQLVANSVADIQRGEAQLSSLLARAVTRGMREL